METQCFSFDDVLVEPASARVFKGGRRVAVEPKAYRVLFYLLERPGRLVEKGELLSAIWPDTFVTENALTRAIALLRKVLGDNKSSAKYIETVPTRGYRFIAEVSARPSSEFAVLGSAASQNGATAGSGSWKRWIVVAAVLGLLAGGTFVGRRIYERIRLQNAGFAALTNFRLGQATNSTRLDIHPTFSQDGNAIAYASDESGSFEIYVRQLSPGGGTIALTHDGGRNLQPAWSPDGATIAYLSQEKGGIWVVPALGGTPRQVTRTGSAPTWSPDGTQIAFQSGNIRDISATAVGSVIDSTIQVVTLRDGSIRSLTRTDSPRGAHNSPAWSPDAKQIAFTTGGLFEVTSLWLVAVGDGTITNLGTAPGLFEPAFARDGQSLYASAALGLWQIPVTARNQKLLSISRLVVDLPPDVLRRVAISPENRKIAFARVRSSSNIYSLPMNGDSPSGPPRAIIRDTRIRKTDPTISPDGKRILFNVASMDQSGGIWVSNIDGSEAQLVSDSGGWPGWLPNSEDFLCAQFLPGHARADFAPDGLVINIWKINVNTHNRQLVRTINDRAQFFAFAPDGSSTVYMSMSNGISMLWRVPLPEGAPERLTSPDDSVGFPSWSPDGKVLAVEKLIGDDTAVALLRPGQRSLTLTSATGQNWPRSWSPDGQKIAFAASREGVWNLRWISVRDRKEKQLTDYTGNSHYVRYPAWSPDGKAIIYEYAETTGNIWVLSLK